MSSNSGFRYALHSSLSEVSEERFHDNIERFGGPTGDGIPWGEQVSYDLDTRTSTSGGSSETPNVSAKPNLQSLEYHD